MIRFTKPCDECGGTDEVGVDGRKSSALNPAQGPCPSCVSGMLPDDDTVEAAGKAVAAERLGTHREPRWGDIDYYAPTARAALVAAARHQKEGE